MLGNLCDGKIRCFKKLLGFLNTLIYKIVNRRNALVIFKGMNKIVLIHIGKRA